MNIKKSILLRVRIAYMAVFLFGLAIVVRIGYIQFAEGEKWSKMAEEIGLQYRQVDATRGNIYSDNGSLLATSLPFFRLAMDPTIVPDEVYRKDLDSLSYLLSRYFRDASAEEYKRKINNARVNKRQYVQLNKTKIGYQDKKMMASWPIFREGRMKGGVIFEKLDVRLKPFSNLGQRTIGFVNEDQAGAGLEYSFNKELAGQHGKALFQKMAGGNWKPVYDGTEVKSINGYDIETTLDVNLQDVAESALLRHLQEHDADYGCVVVMEVKTGEIKAISNLSKLRPGEYWEKYNYAVAGLTAPGSTFKLASMIALFEDSNVKLSDSIDTGNGEYKFYQHTMRDHKPGGYGRITVQEAFEKSSNIAIAKMVEAHFGLQPQRFVDYLVDMGLSQPLGFQMKGEGIPLIKNPKDPSWSGISLPWISHGYEVELTPLQVLALYNAVANNGKMIQPIIVRKVKQADKTVQRYEAKVVNPKICSDKTLEKLRAMLEGVVERGTANNINDTYYKIAGKTGTAQKLIDGKYSKRYYTSFAGYFPADQPKYSAIVVIDNPKGYRQYGSDVAAPVFKEIADKIYSKDLEMHKSYDRSPFLPQGVFPVVQAGNRDDLQFILNTLGLSNHLKHDEEWVVAQRSNNAVELKPKTVAPEKVPDVQGMTLRDALFLLENAGLRVQVQGKGRVVQQSQNPGAKALRGSQITIKLG